jgi:hypothetical protein
MNLPPEIHEALIAFRATTEQNTAVALSRRAEVLMWLETNIASPIVPEWGSTLFLLQPTWAEIEAWMQRSKEHCLAGVDALEMYADRKRLPEGATILTIHAALGRALAQYDTWRFKQAAKAIRHRWPIGPRPRHQIEIPDPLYRAAEILSLNAPHLPAKWIKKLTSGVDPITEHNAMWSALLDVAAKLGVASILDWSESFAEVVSALRRLRGQKLEIETPPETDASVTDIELEQLGSRLAEQNVYLCYLDEGSDNIPLTVLPWNEAWELTSTMSLFLQYPGIEVLGVKLE